MDTQDILIVRRIYETGSVTKAASTLYISPQALSKRLQKIETELNTALFERKPSGVAPTEEGIRFYSESGQLYHLFEKFKESMGVSEAHSLNRITIASSLGVMALVTPDKIREFRRKHLDIELVIKEYPDKTVDALVSEGAVDIGLAVAPVSAELSQIPIRQFPLCVVSKKDTFFDERKEISYRDLSGVPIAIENPDFKVNSIMRSACKSSGVNLDIYFETLELDLAHSLALQGKCAAVSVDCERFLPKGPDADIKRFRNPLYWSIVAVRKGEGSVNKAEQIFIDFICDVFAEM